MIDLSAFAGNRIAILGLGKTGVSSARALLEAGAMVMAWDDSPEKRVEAESAGIPLANLANSDFTQFDALLLSPGIPHSFPAPHPVVQRARATQTRIVCDIDFLCAASPQTDVIAITGTNGKSTTTALIGHILSHFRPVQTGGNIGLPALTLEPLGPEGSYVLEMSSYQLELTPLLQPAGAIMLNITPDHIERHGDLAGYIAAKELIFAHAPMDGRKPVAVLGVDTQPAREMAQRVKATGRWSVIPVSTQKKLDEGIYVENGRMFEMRDGEAVFVMDLTQAPNLKGQHNHENAACAYAVIRHVYGYAPSDIERQMMTFPGLPHRQFAVRNINSVAYINDSKATNADAAARALACYKNIYWILGGLPKEGGLSGLEPYMDRVRHAFLIGKAAEDFAKWLDKTGVSYTHCQTLDNAVAQAHQMAQANRGQPGGAGTVLLSPACASWDQFKSFEHRGDMFAELVNNLPEAIAA